jgi:hypothetical protein
MTITESESPLPTSAHSAPVDADGVETIDLTERGGTPSTRPTFTITDAAAACAVSRKTITRKLGDLALHGAAKDDDGIWRIPVEALLAVGLHPGRSLPNQPPPASRPTPSSQQTVAPPAASTGGSPDVVTIPRQRWDDLRIRLARAEAEASERAMALADARLALRALTAGPATVSAAPPLNTGQAMPSAAAIEPSASGSLIAAPVANQAPQAPRATTPPASVLPQEEPDQAAQLAAARTHAARNGGYVPAAPAAPARKRRWWQSK